jgi:heat shock protein HtpX
VDLSTSKKEFLKMSWIKRIGWFVLVNLLVMVTISIITRLLGVDRYTSAAGINYTQLMGFCLVWGMVGSFISLAMSRIMAKWMMGVKVFKPEDAVGEQQWLIRRVYELAQKAGLKTMPEVGIYESPEVNAFATGPTKSRALVAVSTGLLGRMERDEIEGVLAHEIAHVANGDMVTMTLVQGVVNAFVMFFARVISFFVGQSVKEEQRRMVEFICTLVLQIAFGILGSMVVAWFSRMREFRADQGGATYAGKAKMVGALQRLQRNYDIVDPETDKPALAAFKISGHKSGFMALFSTHPPLEDRIAALQQSKIM